MDKGDPYDVDPKLITDFTVEKFNEYLRVFKSLDINGNGSVTRSEIIKVLHALGYNKLTPEDVDGIIKEADLNNNSSIEFKEFLTMIKKYANPNVGKRSSFSEMVNKTGQTMQRLGDDKSFSTFSNEERSAYAKLITECLHKDKDCEKYFPIDPNTNDVFKILTDGVILCKLVNCAEPGTIDERVINKKKNMNIFLMNENLRLALNASKAIGCQIINIFPETIIDQRFEMILGILWQVLKKVSFAEINLKNYPQLVRLLKEGETLGDLLKLKPEDILLRWFNFHLKNAGHNEEIKNFDKDIKDSVKYTILLNQLNKECGKEALSENDHIKRGNMVLDNSKKIGVDSFITSDDIVKGNSKLNLLYTAAIFNHCHGLDPPTKEEEDLYEKAKLLNDDAEGTREERAFRMWINSLGIDDTYVNNLYDDSESGVMLLKVFDRISPGSVDWKKVDKTSSNKFKKLANCNECITAAKNCKFHIVGIGGTDIHDRVKKSVLAVVWQMMRHHTLAVLGNKTEDDLLKWANELTGQEPKLTSFQSKELKDSVFFINIMAKMEPRAIDWELVNKDGSNEAIENNAKYAISIARKLGATIFLVWEDIKEVKSKMLMTFVAGLFDVYMLEKHLKKQKEDVSK